MLRKYTVDELYAVIIEVAKETLTENSEANSSSPNGTSRPWVEDANVSQTTGGRRDASGPPGKSAVRNLGC